MRGKESRIDCLLQKASKAAARYHAQKTKQQALEGRSAWTNSAVIRTMYDNASHCEVYDFTGNRAVEGAE
jgi:hypothetical protein